MQGNKLKFIILNFLLVFSMNLVCSQTNEIAVRFIGNCGLYMTDGNANIYFDFPYKSGAHNYMEYNLAELDSVKDHPVFIYTHRHSDHYSGKLVRRLSKKLKGQVFTPKNIDQVTKLNSELSDFKIEVFHTKHKFSFNHCSYLITWHGKKIFVSGDTENAETMAALKDVDWSFIPVWLLMDAIEKQIKLKQVSKILAVYHIGPNDNITSDPEDRQLKLLDKQGEIFRISY